MKGYEESGKLGITLLMRVSRHGGGLYLYIPRDIADVHGIEGEDKIEVELKKHYTPVTKPLEAEVK